MNFISIPLSLIDSTSYYSDIDPLISVADEDNNPDYRLIGYATATQNLLPRKYILYLNVNMPNAIRKNSLISATLGLPIVSSIPPVRTQVPSDLPEPQFVIFDDPRQLELNRSQSNSLPIEIKTAVSNNIINSFNLVNNTPTTGTKSFILNNNATNNLDITSVLTFHTNTNTSLWQRNNNISIIVSGIESSVAGIGAINFLNSQINLNYGVVAPESPDITFLSESSYKQVTLGWKKPDDGGSDILKYIVQYAEASGTIPLSSWITVSEPTGNNVIIDNLPLTKDLIFRVAAQNISGISPFSNFSSNIKLSKNLGPVSSLSFNSANPTRIRVRRSLSSEWNDSNPVLAIGEIAYESDTKRLKVGDGISFWSDLSYVSVDSNSIDFPTVPDVFLRVASSEFDIPNNDRIILNLSQNNRLNIVGKEGVTVKYSNDFNSLVFSSDKLYNPISFGTIVNPVSSGTPGSLSYDESWFYFCVNNNFWERAPIDKSWINFSNMTVSATGNEFVGNSFLIFNGPTGIFSTNSDPYPSFAGRPLTNTSTRNFGPLQGSIIPSSKNINFIYRGGSNTHNPMIIGHNEIVGFTFNGVDIRTFSLGPEIIDSFVPAPSGLNFNFDSQNKPKLYSDNCGGSIDFFGLYSYRDGSFIKDCWNTPDLYLVNTYYGQNNYNGDYFRHNNGHSKMIGFCLDGYPIYGPYGYDNALDSNSNIVLIKSSYSGLDEDSHRPQEWKYNNILLTNNQQYTLFRGMFVEDFQYSENYGHLDEFNGRFCLTPEFPQGTYAYFLTFTNETLTIPEFPYIFGFSTKEQRLLNV